MRARRDRVEQHLGTHERDARGRRAALSRQWRDTRKQDEQRREDVPATPHADTSLRHVVMAGAFDGPDASDGDETTRSAAAEPVDAARAIRCDSSEVESATTSAAAPTNTFAPTMNASRGAHTFPFIAQLPKQGCG
jgi:hypothetical protein